MKTFYIAPQNQDNFGLADMAEAFFGAQDDLQSAGQDGPELPAVYDLSPFQGCRARFSAN